MKNDEATTTMTVRSLCYDFADNDDLVALQCFGSNHRYTTTTMGDNDEAETTYYTALGEMDHDYPADDNTSSSISPRMELSTTDYDKTDASFSPPSLYFEAAIKNVHPFGFENWFTSDVNDNGSSGEETTLSFCTAETTVVASAGYSTPIDKAPIRQEDETSMTNNTNGDHNEAATTFTLTNDLRLVNVATTFRGEDEKDFALRKKENGEPTSFSDMARVIYSGYKHDLLEGGSCADKIFSSDGVTSKHVSYDFCFREVGYSLVMFINDDGGVIPASKLLLPKNCRTIVVMGGVEANGIREVMCGLLFSSIVFVCVSHACLQRPLFKTFARFQVGFHDCCIPPSLIFNIHIYSISYQT